MDLNEQMDQNAADFSKVPPPIPAAGAVQSSTSGQVGSAVTSKNVTKVQVFLVLGALFLVLGIFYYLLSRPRQISSPPPRLSPPSPVSR